MFLKVLSWAEAWAVVFPIVTFLTKKQTAKPLRIVFLYLCIAILLHTWADLSVVFYYQLSGFLKHNNWVYNLHSITITVCFISFFQSVNLKSKWLNARRSISAFLFIVAVIFLFIDDFFLVSSKLFAFEGLFLLTYCMAFFLQRLKEDEVYLDFDPYLVIVIGLSIYESTNFFIFLFYNVLMTSAVSFAVLIWNVHNVVYIIFCLFITYAFYGRTRFLYS